MLLKNQYFCREKNQSVSNLLAAILYYLVILPVSKLPFSVLYAFSDFLFFILYRIIGYRRKVVESNIRNSFPDYTPEKRKEIVEAFYRHLCDLVVESLKGFSISEEEAKKRVICLNPEVLDAYYDKGQRVILFGGHINNWEMFAVAVSFWIKHKPVGIYAELTNHFFNEKIKKSRSKYGLLMIPRKIVKDFFANPTPELTATIFAIDQSPSNPNKCYWTTFLNQDTGVTYGAELYAKEYNQPVVYGRINKIKRGHYSFEFIPVMDEPKNTSFGEIMEIGTRMLEKDILATPQYWLWSHRRWKNKRPAGL